NDSSIQESDWPVLTKCFENTVLVWIPCGWLWLTTPLYLFHLYYNGRFKPKIPISPLSISKFTLCTLLCIMCTIETIQTVTGCVCEEQADENCECEDRDVSDDTLVSGILKPVTFLLAGILTQIERLRGVVSSVILFVFWLLLVLAGIVPCFTKILDKDYEEDLFRFVVFYIYFFFISTQLVLHAFAEDGQNGSITRDKNPCPERKASVLNKLYFWWMNSIVFKAYKTRLYEDDLWSLNPKDQSVNIIPDFDRRWNKELDSSFLEMNVSKQKSKKCLRNLSSDPTEKSPLLESISSSNSGSEFPNHHGNYKFYRLPSLIKVLCKTYGMTFLASLFFKLLSDVLQFASPIFLSILIDFSESKTSPDWIGYMAASGMFICTIFQSVFYHQNFQLGMTVGMRIKSALISAIYKKI
ncbi:hypothetical protein KUTeg_010373, partial [Tegillarca granosa]